MGLRMDDLHTPSVPSGPSSGATNGAPKDQLSLTELIAERDRIQSEILGLADVLDSVRTVSSSKFFEAEADRRVPSTESL